MDPGVITGAGALVTALGAAAVAWRKGGTENWSTLLASYNSHLDSIKSENVDLRARMAHAEDRVLAAERIAGAAQLDVARCESDKREMQFQIDELRRMVQGG